MNEEKPTPASLKIGSSLAVAGASAALAVALSVALRPSAGAPDFVQFLGRFHTLAIHLPIGVLLLVAAAEALCLASPRLRARLDPGLDLALPFLVATSAAAFALGILLARGGGYPSRLVALHRGFTLAAVIGSAASLVAWALGRRAAYRGALGVTVLLLTVGAHYGGSMTRGESYLVRYAPRFAQKLLGEATPEAAPVDAAKVISAEPLVFHDVLLPMLKQRCVECHGADQAKGGLRLDSFAALAKGGEHGPVMLAGRGGSSSLVERMTLPAGNDERMPPDEKPAPSSDEIQLVRWWIDRGASEGTRVRDGVVPDGARALLSQAALVSTSASASPDVASPPKAAPLVVAPPPGAPLAVASPHAGPRLVFRDVVAPLLAARCASCHGAAKQKGKLRVDSLEALLAGGKGGAAIVPGNASGGTLLARSHLSLDDEKHMPPAKEPQLDATQIELVAWWISGGASATQTTEAMPARFAGHRAAPAVAMKSEPPPASSRAAVEPSPPTPPLDAPPSITGPVLVYAELVAPILRRRCGECHLGAHVSGGLRVDDYDKMVAELDIVPGKPEESALVKRMLLPLSNDDRMPPSDKPQATAAEIEAVRVWIAKGARRDQTIDAQELPRDLLGGVEKGPGVAATSPAAANAAQAEAKPPATIAPAAIPPAQGSGCATCTVGGARNGSSPARSLAVTGLLALAYVARRARRTRR
jgi:mono/diheme cytochrome c family protein